MAGTLPPPGDARAGGRGLVRALDVVTAGLAVAANIAGTVYIGATAVKAGGELMEGHYKDAFMDAANVAMSRFGGKKGGKEGEPEGPGNAFAAKAGHTPGRVPTE